MSYSKRTSEDANLPWPSSRPHHSSYVDFDADGDDEQPVPEFEPTGPMETFPPTHDPQNTDADDQPETGPSSSVLQAPETSNFRPFSYAQYGSDRAVHTITFKLWNSESRHNKELFVQETRIDGYTRSYDPEHFFYKLTGDRMQSNRMADYWRSFYDVPLRHTPPDATPSLYTTDTPTIPSDPQTVTHTLISETASLLYIQLYGTGGALDPNGTLDLTTWPASDLSDVERLSLMSALSKLGRIAPNLFPSST